MPDERRHYLAYLLRVWDASSAGLPLWHASLEDPQTSQRHGFASLESLCAFLAEQLTVQSTVQPPSLPVVPDPPPDAVKGGDHRAGPSQMDDQGFESD